MNVYKPSQVLRKIKAGTIADPQPRGTARILCEAKRHLVEGETESPSYWENGMYTFCQQCNAYVLARPCFKDFEIDLTGERKRYPMYGTITK